MRTQADVRQNVSIASTSQILSLVNNITLTIDERIQYTAERELKRPSRQPLQDRKIVVMNPKTGEILAMTSYPTYNPNENPEEGENLSTALEPRRIGAFEPGSVFKVITIAAALETTNIKPIRSSPAATAG